MVLHSVDWTTTILSSLLFSSLLSSPLHSTPLLFVRYFLLIISSVTHTDSMYCVCISCHPINVFHCSSLYDVDMQRRWSTIAAQLPGRTDNEIKNYWNTHLKKRLLRMGINPDTYAPAASPSSPGSTAGAGGAGGGASSSAFPATRHMAQWESARLEAEARLSRESLLFSSAASASTSAAAAAAGGGGGSLHSDSPNFKPEPDFFLRIWNSEVGDAFRKPVSAPRDSAPPAGSSPESSSTKQSSAVTVSPAAAVKEEQSTESKSCMLGAGGGGGGGDRATAEADSSGSNEVEDTSEETYQLYLDFVGDELGLFSSQLGGFSLFSSDLHDASLDTAFK